MPADHLYGTNTDVGDEWPPNSTATPTGDGHLPSVWGSWFLVRAVLGPSAMLATLLGNLLVVYAYAASRRLRTYTNHYLVGLAVADLVSGGLTPALENVSWMLETWPFGEALCTANVYINHIFLHATFLMTLTICVDRYRALTKPLRHRREKTLRHALWMISCTYAVPFVIWTPLIVILPYSGVMQRVLPPECNGAYGNHRPLLVFAIAVLSWIPMLCTIVLYLFVFRAVLRGRRLDKREARDLYRVSGPMNRREERWPTGARQKDLDRGRKSQSRAKGNSNRDPGESTAADDLREKQITTQTRAGGIDNGGYLADERSRESEETEFRGASPTNDRAGHSGQPAGSSGRSLGRRLASLRATRTLTYIIVAMLVSALPWSTLAFLAVVNPQSAPDKDVFRTTSWLVHLSSVANPFCYAASNPHFKRAFLRVLCCGRRAR